MKRCSVSAGSTNTFAHQKSLSLPNCAKTEILASALFYFPCFSIFLVNKYVLWVLVDAAHKYLLLDSKCGSFIF